MAERAAHLVDHVFPDVPVRQWVLSLPYRLRYQLAWDHDLCRAVVAVYMSAAALRYLPRPDPDPGLGDRIVALAHRHRRYGAGMIYLKLRQEGHPGRPPSRPSGAGAP